MPIDDDFTPRLGRIRDRNINRQNDVILVAECFEAKDRKAVRGRPKDVCGAYIFGPGPVKLRREPGIACAAPVNLPVGLQFVFKAKTECLFAAGFGLRTDQAD